MKARCCGIAALSNFNATEFIQYRKPVGAGPSLKTCPKWASQRLQIDSVRTIPSDRSTTLVTALGPVSYTHLTLPTICSV